MDPFLEHPDIFPDFHDRFVTHLSEAIQQQLPAGYIAGLGRRAWIEVSERYVGPDVQVVRPRWSPSEAEDDSAVAVADRLRTRPVVIRVPHDERREPYVEIYVGRGANRRLVTAIEVLSLTNKTPGEHGRDLYVQKQREILQGKVHLVEIDLLRAGEHTTAVPLKRLKRKVRRFDYHVCIHHFDSLEEYFVYPVGLSDPLPEIHIPLLPADPPVRLELQTVFTRTYDAGPYKHEIDYAHDTPVPALTTKQQEWLQQLLQSHPRASRAGLGR
jgi:hypothetical protein